MATSGLNKKILPAIRNLFIARTNSGLWARLLLLFAIGNIIGITLSLYFYFSVRNIGNRVIESTLELPNAQEIDKEHIHDVLSAFSARAATFRSRLNGGISISEPYER